MATIESLLHPKKPSEGSQVLIDLSRLADQDKVISSEFKWSLQAIEKLEKDIDDSNFRRIIDEVHITGIDQHKFLIQRLFKIFILYRTLNLNFFRPEALQKMKRDK